MQHVRRTISILKQCPCVHVSFHLCIALPNDILHVHDWHSLLPGYLHEGYLSFTMLHYNEVLHSCPPPLLSFALRVRLLFLPCLNIVKRTTAEGPISEVLHFFGATSFEAACMADVRFDELFSASCSSSEAAKFQAPGMRMCQNTRIVNVCVCSTGITLITDGCRSTSTQIHLHQY